MQYDQVRELLLQQWTYTGGPNEDKAAVFYHDDAVLEFPQSGEWFRGKENIQGWRQQYPMKLDFHPQEIRGGGDLWVAEAVLTYDGTNPVHVIKIMQFRGDKIARETLYFADPFPAPDWRKPWAETGSAAQAPGRSTRAHRRRQLSSLPARNPQRRRAFSTARTPTKIRPPASSHGPATMIGSSGWCTRSARFCPIREAIPRWENSLTTPVSVIGLSGRRRQHRLQVSLTGVDPVRRQEQQPVRRAAFAVAAVGDFANRAREPGRWARRTEDRCEELVLDRALPRPLLGLAVREVPVGAGRAGVETFPRERRPVLRIEVDAPSGDASA